jgi:hypothetical protein
LSEESILHSSHLTASATGGTGLCTAFVFGATAPAGSAGNMFFYFDILADSFGNFFVSQFQFDAKITSSYASGTRTATASLTSSSKKTTKKIVSENIPKLTEDIIHVHAASVAASSGSTHSGMTKSVVLCAFVAITQHFVSFGSLFEFFLCGFVARISVWVILHGYLTIRFLDLIGSGRFAYA